MTPASPRFAEFIAAVDPLIRRSRDYAETVHGIEPHLKLLVGHSEWLEEPFRRALPSKPYAQYLLYRPEDSRFSVVSFVWNPGQGSPVHDHCTWGVIGQCVGEEEESRYRIDGGRLVRMATVASRVGDVSHVYPPNRDIHQILNRSAQPTISIHIYGGDIGSQARHIFDPETAQSRPFVSGYDIPW